MLFWTARLQGILGLALRLSPQLPGMGRAVRLTTPQNSCSKYFVHGWPLPALRQTMEQRYRLVRGLRTATVNFICRYGRRPGQNLPHYHAGAAGGHSFGSGGSGGGAGDSCVMMCASRRRKMHKRELAMACPAPTIQPHFRGNTSGTLLQLCCYLLCSRQLLRAKWVHSERLPLADIVRDLTRCDYISVCTSLLAPASAWTHALFSAITSCSKCSG